MALDPYETLKIPKTATLEEIKAAYRAIVQWAHPDKCPNDPFATYRFQQIQEAYSILRSVERRREFDAGRDVDGPRKLRERAQGLFMLVLNNAIDAAADNGDIDFIEWMRGQFKGVQSNARAGVGVGRRRVVQLEGALRRYKFKGADPERDLVRVAMRQRIDKERAAIEQAEGAIAEAVEAEVILAEYEQTGVPFGNGGGQFFLPAGGFTWVT